MPGGSASKKRSKKQKYKQNQLNINNENSNHYNDNNSNNSWEESKKRKLDETLTEMQMNMQKFEFDLFELKDKYDESVKRTESLEETVESLKEKLKLEEYKNSILMARNNDLEQYSRRNNIRVFGIVDSERETADKSEKLVTDLLKKKLSIDIAPSKIQIAHRAGKFTSGGNRSIIMQFVNRKEKQNIMKVRKNLKGTGISIAEDLTPLNVRRLSDLKKLDAVESAWSSQGKLFAKKSGRPEMVREIASHMLINENIFDPNQARSLRQQTLPQSSGASPSATSAKTTATTNASVAATTTTAASTSGPATSSQTTSSQSGSATTSLTTSLASGPVTSSQTMKSSKNQSKHPSVKSASDSSDKNPTDMDTSEFCEKPTPKDSSTPKTRIQLRLEDMAQLNNK